NIYPFPLAPFGGTTVTFKQVNRQGGMGYADLWVSATNPCTLANGIVVTGQAMHFHSDGGLYSTLYNIFLTPPAMLTNRVAVPIYEGAEQAIVTTSDQTVANVVENDSYLGLAVVPNLSPGLPNPTSLTFKLTMIGEDGKQIGASWVGQLPANTNFGVAIRDAFG